MKRTIIISTISAIIIVFCIIPGYLYPIFEILDAIDKQLTIALNFNGGSIVDAILYAMSSRITCSICVLIAITLYFLRKKPKLRRYLVIVLGLTLVITLCVQISASVIKPYVCRLRPSHTIGVCEFLHYVYGYKGGQYGFVSSHAANTLGAAAFLSYIIKNKRITIYLFTWAFIVCYSRIYLGVHYLGDVICGGILGAAIGFTTAFAIHSIIIRYITWKRLRSYKAQLR